MKDKKIKRIILVGKAASGKDHARKELERIGLIYGVSYTTRSSRKGEVHGKDYYFLTEEEFLEKNNNDEWYEYVQFNGWMYGTTKTQFHKECEVFIMTPIGLSHLDEKDRKESFVIYLDMNYPIRHKRLKERSDNDDSISRRMAADEVDFYDFLNWDVKVNDHEFDIVNDIIFPAIKVKQISFNEHIINKVKAYEYQS